MWTQTGLLAMKLLDSFMNLWIGKLPILGSLIRRTPYPTAFFGFLTGRASNAERVTQEVPRV
jgi:hypothetical protein